MRRSCRQLAIQHQIELVEILGKLGNHFAGLAFAVGPDSFEQAGERVEQSQIVFDDAFHVWAQNLHGHFMAAIFRKQSCKMRLRYRGAGDRCCVELGKHFVCWPAVSPAICARKRVPAKTVVLIL